MRVWMQWHGGASYAPPCIDDPNDTEVFDTLRAALHSFDVRRFDSFYPCVSDETPEDGGPEAWLYFADPHSEEYSGEPYPDRIVKFGPRGGIRVEHA